MMKSELMMCFFVAKCFSTFQRVWSGKYLGGRMSSGLIFRKIQLTACGKTSSIRFHCTLLMLFLDSGLKFVTVLNRSSCLNELSRKTEPLICLLKRN